MASFIAPMSYQDIQNALTELQKKYVDILKMNRKLSVHNTQLNKAFLTGKMDQYIFKGLYKGGNINIVTLTGKKISINIRYNDTVDSLAQKIYEQEGIPTYNQRLIFGGKRLKPHRSLYSYKIPIDATIHLVMDMQPMRCPWAPSDPKEIADDQYYIDNAIKKLVENRQFKLKYGNIHSKT